MFQSVGTFLKKRGFTIVLIGFAITAVCIISYMYSVNHHLSAQLRSLAFNATFAGIGIIAVGRIGMFMENNARRKKADAAQVTSNKDTV